MQGADHQDEMLRFVATALEEIGPRESCSENERRLGRLLAERWLELGCEVRTERFSCHPKAFLGFIPFSVLLYLSATILYWVWPLACAALAAMSVAPMIFELLRYREFIDRLFPSAEGENVVGIISPRGEVRRRVVVSAHQDSAYEFHLWFFLGNVAIPLMVIGFLALFVPFLGGIAKALAADPHGHTFTLVGYACIALYPIVGLNLFFHTYWAVPGAMDDLTGISVLLGVARALGGSPLEHTEVRLLAASSEEAGLRGSKRYVSAHRDELTQVPTYGLFVDGVCDERHLGAFRRELFTGAAHDPRLVRLAGEIAAARGFAFAEHTLTLGATDATPFSLAGVPSVSMHCQDVTRLVPNYHTRRDTLENVRPASLGVMLEMVLEMTRRIDADRLPEVAPAAAPETSRAAGESNVAA